MTAGCDNCHVLAEAFMHPTAQATMRYLEEFGEAAPSDMADALGIPLANVVYHVRSLVDRGLIEETRSEPRRGALKHFYVRTHNPLAEAVTAALVGSQEAA